MRKNENKGRHMEEGGEEEGERKENTVTRRNATEERRGARGEERSEISDKALRRRGGGRESAQATRCSCS